MAEIMIAETDWRGVDAWRLTGGDIEVVLTRVGAHLAAITGRGERLNPLWQPPWPATSPRDGVNQPEVYGDGPEASLLAGIVGHNLCLDRFGPPRPGETRPVHGEAGVATWKLVSPDEPARGGSEVVRIAAELLEARLSVERAFRMEGDELLITTSVTHRDDEPRAIEWAEHVTIGDPFLDGAVFRAETDAAWIWGGEPRETWRFPDAEPEGEVDVAAALAMPLPDAPPAGDIVATRLTRGWFRAERADLGRFLEYEWDADEFPWLCLWTQHQSRTGKPWNGVTRARGMEFSTKPFPEGEPPAERVGSFHGRSTTCIVPAGEGLVRSMIVRWGRT
ncbi:MAG: hypothetical protein ACOC2Q_01910 [Spirochaetota bacterium]